MNLTKTINNLPIPVESERSNSGTDSAARKGGPLSGKWFSTKTRLCWVTDALAESIQKIFPLEMKRK